jgi:hypothetical protein
VIYGCPIARWNLITAPHPTLPFQTAGAFEQSPEDPNLSAKIAGEVG